MNYSKKAILALVLFALPFLSNAQANMSIEKGNVLLSPSVTLGWFDYGYNQDIVNILPPVGFGFEYASSNYFSFGLEAEYGLRRYRDIFFTTNTYEYKYEYKALSLRGSFHYLDFIKNLLEDKIGSLNSDKLDFYIGASTGIITTTTTESWTTGTNTAQNERKDFESAWRFGYMAGFRYYFSNSFGTFLETGRNTLGWAKIGLTLKI